MISPEAQAAFQRNRQAVIDLVPYPTQERFTQLFQETRPKVKGLLDQSGIFSQLPPVVNQEAVINKITRMYAMVHDYKMFDRLIIAAARKGIFPQLIEDRPDASEGLDTGIGKMTEVAIRMKHGSISIADIPYIESRRIFEAHEPEEEDHGFSNQEIFDYFQRVPVYPISGRKSVLEGFSSTREYAELPLSNGETKIYIGELVPQRPAA